MSLQTKEMVLGDVVKSEYPHEYCRVNKRVSRNLTATLALPVGEIMEPDGNAAQVHTFDMDDVSAWNPDGGTYKLGYKGEWTTALAWNADAATIKAAFELLSTVTDTITASNAIDHAVTITWGTAGVKDEIEVDARLLTDGGLVCGDSHLDVTTIGSTTADMVIIATGGNATGILLEKVTLADLKGKNDLYRAFLISGPAVVDSDNLYAVAAQLAAAKTALAALTPAMRLRTEPDIYQSGPPIA